VSATGRIKKLGLSIQRFSFQSERHSAAKEVYGCGLLSHTPVEIAGHVPEGASQWVVGDNPPSDLIGHQDEIAERRIQMVQQELDLHSDLFLVVLEMIVEIPQPHGEAINDNHVTAARPIGEHTEKFNGLLDRVELIAPFFPMPGDPVLHLLINGNSRGDESPFGIVLEAERKSERALSASGPSGNQSDLAHVLNAP
jgi:hypothetical protein